MKQTLRVLAGLVIGLVALLLIGSVACPPISERATPPPPELLDGLVDPPSAAEIQNKPAANAHAERADSSTDLPPALELHFLLDGLDALPDDLTVHLEPVDAKGPRARVSPTEDGVCRIRKIPDGDWVLRIQASGCFLPEPRLLSFPQAFPYQSEVNLRAAGRIRGVVRNQKGRPVSWGTVRATLAGETEGKEARPNAHGQFSLDGLENGLWQVAYFRHAQDEGQEFYKKYVQVDLNMEFTISIVIESKPAPDPKTALDPGIEVLSEGSFRR
ncbi:MAG: carboxypeptidase-like regulatory domain-containing protein [Planctomycetes bacterium]|nr:carboxypeptidase-like regulatory domain-containing protein [Planctomycetota bacterium]